MHQNKGYQNRNSVNHRSHECKHGFNQNGYNEFNNPRSTILIILILVFSFLKPILGDNQLRAPVIIEQPVDVTVRRNDPATLSCKTEGNPLPTVEWFKDSIKIRPSKNPMILPSGSLFFFQVDQVRG